ncbi:MAG: 4-coumarate--CoA ligase family protein [Pseudonocardiaceae bacterium]
MPFCSPFPDVEIPAVSLTELIFAEMAADRPALIDGVSGQVITYRRLQILVNRVAGALAARGVGKGDVVAMFAPNTPYYVVVFHGILRAGAVATTVNSLYTPQDIAKQLHDSGAKLLFTVSSFLDRAAAATGQPGVSIETVVLDGAPGYSSLADLLAQNATAPEVSIDPATDLAVLPYSSGTTGHPKGVMLTHRNLVANIAQCRPLLQVDQDTRVLAVLPFFHIYGMVVLMNLGLWSGATVVTLPKFDLEMFLRTIQEYRTDRVYIAPPVAVALAKHPMVDDFDLSAMEFLFSGAAPLDAELAGAVRARLGCKIRQGYGMTELSPVSHAIPMDRDDISVGTVGFTLPNMECKLVDPETGQEVGEGQLGELWCRGPNVMLGYLHNTEATLATVDSEGYLHTGDVAMVDADGVVTIVDRVKELIKYKGYQVPPAELEALLLTHPKIADAAVIGVRDADGEEVPKAFVVTQSGAEDLTGDDVMAFVAEQVSPHKKVRAVQFIDQIPKSASGKILRKDLRAVEPTAT